MRILIIDDDPASTDLFTLMLQQSITAEIITANSSNEGIAMSRKYQPDLIMLNLMMPVMNGIDVCREVRKFYHRPILVLSAINQPELIANALDAGADDCLCKPVGRSMLTTRIAGLLRRTQKSNSQHNFSPTPTFTTINL